MGRGVTFLKRIQLGHNFCKSYFCRVIFCDPSCAHCWWAGENCNTCIFVDKCRRYRHHKSNSNVKQLMLGGRLQCFKSWIALWATRIFNAASLLMLSSMIGPITNHEFSHSNCTASISVLHWPATGSIMVTPAHGVKRISSSWTSGWRDAKTSKDI